MPEEGPQDQKLQDWEIALFEGITQLSVEDASGAADRGIAIARVTFAGERTHAIVAIEPDDDMVNVTPIYVHVTQNLFDRLGGIDDEPPARSGFQIAGEIWENLRQHGELITEASLHAVLVQWGQIIDGARP